MLKSLIIRSEEKIPATIVLLFLAFLNSVMTCYQNKLFTHCTGGFYSVFWGNFHFSGFDPTSYLTLSQWEVYYAEYRHPLLSFFLYPLERLNHLLMLLTGYNFAIYIVAIIMTLCGIYSFIFFFRICKDILEVKYTDALLLSLLLFSFSYIMLSLIVPDHFGFSLTMLLFVLYRCGIHIKKEKMLSSTHTIVLFMLTAGITLSNGIKVFLAALYCNGKSFFYKKYILLSVILPTLLILAIGVWQYKQLIVPYRLRGKHMQEQRITKDSKYKAQLHNSKNRLKIISGKQIKSKGFLSLTNISLKRRESIIENMIGEPIVIHQQHILEDIHNKRPIIVKYKYNYHYAILLIIILMALAGIWKARKKVFLWLILSWLAIDVLLHAVLGFALNEVYIMAAHWIFILPILCGMWIKSCSPKVYKVARLIILITSVYLISYNTFSIVNYILT